jgi:hypothetical protein
MTARNMVRNLRDSGALDAPPPPARIRPWLATVLAGLAFGLTMYFGATLGVPVLLEAIQNDPPPVHFAKPGPLN